VTFAFKSLQQRLVVLLLLPVAGLLLGGGLLAFLSARERMLDQWRQAALLRLERAAHYLDMRLGRPIDLVELLGGGSFTGGRGMGESQLLEVLRGLEGVTAVNLDWLGEARPGPGMLGRGGMGRFRRAMMAEVRPPVLDAISGQQQVSLFFSLKDATDQPIGRLEVVMSFDHLLKDIRSLGWWQSDAAYLVDDSGRYLASAASAVKGRQRLGETGDSLELATLKALQSRLKGTLLGPGHPAREISGFFRLSRAPWTIVLFAPGARVLAPIIHWRNYFILAGLACVGLVLILIRLVTGRLVRTIGQVSEASVKVARGEAGPPLEVRGRDEIGRLAASFNAMVEGLKERDFIRDTFGRYVDQEVARELLRRPEATRLGGQKRQVAIMMSDVRGFTALCESLSAEQTIAVINRYLSQLIAVIQEHHGIIVDFLGDAVLVFFDPLDGPIEPAVRRAVDCALAMRRSTAAFNEQIRREGLPELETGIGLNAGEVVVGNIGSETRTKYGIVGAPVNLTQRLQAAAQGGEVVASDSVRRHLAGELDIERSFRAELKGLQEPVLLHIVAGLSAPREDQPGRP